MKYLVTGGTGFIGSNIALELHKQGHDVWITGNNVEQRLPEFKGKLLQCSFLGLDWERIGKVDAVFHQAAINDNQYPDRKEVFRANVEASLKLFDELYKRGCRKFIYASSTAVYGNVQTPYKEYGPKEPVTHYGESKLELEKQAAQWAGAHPDSLVVGLRYCNVFGPRENHKRIRATMIYHFAHQMQTGNPKAFEFGEQKRDYIYIKDVVRANLLALEAKENCIVNCAGGIAISFNDVVKILNRILGFERQVDYIKNPYDNYQEFTQCDITKAKELLKFEPEYTVETGIEDYYKSGWLLKPCKDVSE